MLRHPCRVVALALVAGACSAPVDVSWHQESGYRWRALAVPSRGEAGFTALSARATGLTHRNDVSDEHALANRNLLIGAGVALGDVDGDGLPDVVLTSLERPAALYHNDGNFHFTDITTASGIRTTGLSTLSAAFADVNGDGALDLVVGTLGGPIKLWLGDGRGHFTDATEGSGLVGGYAATALTFADIDGDGHLDLYVGTYKTRNALDAYPPEARTFEQVVRKVGGNRYVVEPRWAAEYRVEDRPDLGGVMRSQRADPDLLFLNDGHGHFTRTPIAGPRFLDESGKPLSNEPDYFTLAARFYDVNGDGAPDLYVCNDFEDPDQFWLNDGKGHFRLVPGQSMRESSNTCMSVDFGDVNRDGHVDIFTADMMSPTLAARQQQFPTHAPVPKPVRVGNDRQQWMRNMLQLSRGNGSWAQIADFAGVAASDWTWGSAFVDVDLDGYEDLLVLNGHRWDVRDADTYQRIHDKHTPWNREQGEFPRLAAHSVAFRNNGNLTFSNASIAWRFGADSGITNGIALADLDGDGDIDVVTTRLDDTPIVYRTETAAPRIAVRLRGAAPNTEGIGASVTVRAASIRPQTREITAGGYYLSGSAAELAFAAGRDTVLSLEVRWRDGKKSVIAAEPNRMYEIDEAAAADRWAPARDSMSGLFENATALLGGHTHTDSAFDDYRRQPLLPNKFSQLGPGLSWIDVDGDGREDLVVGSGSGGRLTVLRNRDGGFAAASPPGAAAPWDLTTVVPVPDASGGLTLVAGQSNYESGSPEEALSIPRVLSFPLRAGLPLAAKALLSPDTGSVGPMALGDVNGDGRLDLLVGARVVPGAWPLPARSHLYLRTADGGWAPDTLNDRVIASVGLVSAAVFADLDGDGHPDLAVTTEWGPVRVFHNESGRLRDVTREWGFAGQTSRWNGLAVGDLDGDGRLDLVATSWGRNTPWRASPDRPYELVTGNFGGAGLGLLFAQRDSATSREMPLESLARLAVAVPQVTTRYSTYAAFSKATVDDVLGEASESAVRVGATTFDHIVFFNRGAHFEAKPLPAEAQLAPAFGIVVADFDGDGNEDLFLAQNFSQTALETPRFDGGAGLILLGEGNGNFRPLSVQASGISVIGDQRGAAAADFDADGRVDVAVSQNAGPTTLWRNRGARPGLRVRLDGPLGNPLAIGARFQVSVAGKRGPVRELHAGSGYWSMDAATTVMSLPAGADSLVVRWPGGREQVVPLSAGQREVRLGAK